MLCNSKLRIICWMGGLQEVESSGKLENGLRRNAGLKITDSAKVLIPIMIMVKVLKVAEIRGVEKYFLPNELDYCLNALILE